MNLIIVHMHSHELRNYLFTFTNVKVLAKLPVILTIKIFYTFFTSIRTRTKLFLLP